jgi:hypothetical protein
LRVRIAEGFSVGVGVDIGSDHRCGIAGFTPAVHA